MVKEIQREKQEERMKQIFTDYGHPEGRNSSPWFEIRNDEIYTIYGHPEGRNNSPWFEIRG